MAENTPGNGADQEQDLDISLMVKVQYTKDLSFENPSAPEVLTTNIEPEVDINVNVEAAKLKNGDFEVILKISATAKTDKLTVFVTELVYAGVFTLGGELPEEVQAQILLIECPRILFPFARNIIADATRDGGFPPLMLQPIDFAQLFQEEAIKQGGMTPS
jgi:preprotein translocase subunit SecB